MQDSTEVNNLDCTECKIINNFFNPEFDDMLVKDYTKQFCSKYSEHFNLETDCPIVANNKVH